MKKLFAGILAGTLMLTAGCASKPAQDPEEIVNDTINSISGEMYFDGTWTDAEDENLTMICTETAENEYDIIVTWGKTDKEADQWTMHGTYDPASGMLKYENGKYVHLKMNPDGNETQEDETTVSGSMDKMGDMECIWHDSKVESARTMKKTGTIPTIKLAEGPYVMENISRVALSEEEKTRFETAVRGEIGVLYTPIQVVASQVVNGTNYEYLAFGTYDLGIPKSTYVLATVYEDLDGNAELGTVNFLDANDLHTSEEADYTKLVGGWKIIENGADGLLNHEVDDVFFKALNGDYNGEVGNIVTIALLGTDVENDKTSYRILARGTTEAIYPEKMLYVFDVEQSGDTCTVTSVAPLDFLKYLEN